MTQVKFKREQKVGDNHVTWLRDAVEDERPKIEALAERGAEEYLLVTNVRGTGKLDVGSMDKVAELLGSLPLPTQVLWRDDLDAKLTNNSDLKWFFSEILATPDVIRQFNSREVWANIESGGTEQSTATFDRNIRPMHV